MTLIKAIRSERVKKKLPLRKLAAAVDVDTSTWSKIEKGERQLREEMLLAICELLDMDFKEAQIQFWADRIEDELMHKEYAVEILYSATERFKGKKNNEKH